MDWINLAQDKGQLVGCCDEGDERLGSIIFEEIFDYLRKY
jgi:hypothetical protein